METKRFFGAECNEENKNRGSVDGVQQKMASSLAIVLNWTFVYIGRKAESTVWSNCRLWLIFDCHHTFCDPQET